MLAGPTRRSTPGWRAQSTGAGAGRHLASGLALPTYFKYASQAAVGGEDVALCAGSPERGISGRAGVAWRPSCAADRVAPATRPAIVGPWPSTTLEHGEAGLLEVVAPSAGPGRDAATTTARPRTRTVLRRGAERRSHDRPSRLDDSYYKSLQHGHHGARQVREAEFIPREGVAWITRSIVADGKEGGVPKVAHWHNLSSTDSTFGVWRTTR